MVIEDAYEFTKPNPWRWPDEFEIEDALESVRQMGGQVVRTYVLSVHREGSDMGDFVHVRGPGEFNEEGFRALDKVIEVARRKGIRVIIPFVDQRKWWGGIGEYAAFRGKPADAFWTDPQIIDDFKATVRYLHHAKEHVYTGVAYRDEPAIFGWETGNEIDRHARVDARDRGVHQGARSESSGDRRQVAQGRARGVAGRSEHRRDHDAPLSVGR